jgi:YggT family protein
VNALSCNAAWLLVALARAYTFVLIGYAILSWIPDLQRYQRYLDPFVLPVLRPLQRVIPPVGGLDLSFLVLILVIQLVVMPLLGRLSLGVCYGL